MVRVMKPKQPVPDFTQAEMRQSLAKKQKEVEEHYNDSGDELDDDSQDDLPDEDEGDLYQDPEFDPDEPEFIAPPTRKRVRKPKEVQEDDIFEYCEKNYVNKGIPIRYEVRRNGYFAGELEHPCSWKIIQDNYGGGLFALKAKHGHNSQIVKRQSISINQTNNNAPQKIIKEDDDNMAQPQVIERIIEREAPQQQFNFLELFSLMNKSNAEAQHSIKESQRESQNSQNTLTAALLQILSNKPQPETKSDDKIMALMMQMQQNTNQMFEKMMENTQKSIEAVQKNNEKMMDKVSERIEKMGDSGSGLKYSPEQIMQLMMQGQDRGFQMWQGLDKMADLKAAQRMEMLESTRGEAVEDARPKSMTEKLIDTMLPVVASAIQAQAASVSQQQRAPAPQPKAPQQQVRAPQPQIQAKTAQLPPPVAHKPKPKHAAVAAAAATAPLKNVTPATTKKSSNGFPSAVAEQVENVPQENLLPIEDEQKFIQYMNFAAITLTECYTGQKPIPDTAQALIESLKPQRIGTADFLRTCPIKKVAETMKVYGADETVLHFVEEVYAYIEASTIIGTGGEGLTGN